MSLEDKKLWGVELHFKNGDVAFVENNKLLMMKLVDIKSTYISYSSTPQLTLNQSCAQVYLKIHKSILMYPQKNGVYCEDGQTILDMVNTSSIESIGVVDTSGKIEEILVPWNRGAIPEFNTSQKQRLEIGDLVIEIGGQK